MPISIGNLRNGCLSSTFRGTSQTLSIENFETPKFGFSGSQYVKLANIYEVWLEKTRVEKSIEKQRPPIYNPEDYAILLKKWGKKSANGMISLYTNSSTSEIEGSRSQSNTLRDYRNPMLTSAGSEMTLRQFGTVSELLAKLKSDLRLAYPSLLYKW
ncbi:hypothetical protein NQ318_007112 [Aromia moschata]|uniref:Uncharacterized protein n=1 Tax=Aromia moschata TaxID=1265417 RepID=A0AAV8X8U1_9CUCU|nr:hypothetical protein NQ318_007112 [Aromia moschata]